MHFTVFLAGEFDRNTRIKYSAGRHIDASHVLIECRQGAAPIPSGGRYHLSPVIQQHQVDETLVGLNAF